MKCVNKKNNNNNVGSDWGLISGPKKNLMSELETPHCLCSLTGDVDVGPIVNVTFGFTLACAVMNMHDLEPTEHEIV